MNMQSTPRLSFAAKMITVLGYLEERRSLIEAALAHGELALTYDLVAARVMSGRYDFYPLKNSAIIADVEGTGDDKTYMLVVGAGDIQELIDFGPVLYSVAKDKGCKTISLTGRLGWAKALKAHGWRTSHVVMSRGLES